QPALVKRHLAVVGAFDKDLAALFLGDPFEAPGREMRAHVQHNDFAPSSFAITFRLGLDGRALSLPESFSVREITLLAEQVVDDLAGIFPQRKQRRRGWDRRTAA